jgi:hypothetical protein
MADPIVISGTPIFADVNPSRASAVQVPPGFKVATSADAGFVSGTPSTPGTYFDQGLNAWLTPTAIPTVPPGNGGTSNNPANGVGGQGNSTGGGGVGGGIGADQVSSVKTPVANIVSSNPMHQFASWTYNWSLWWLDVNDYNDLMDGADVGDALAQPLRPTSYVIAEDSGIYPNRRLPSTLGLNYNIQDVSFDTIVGLNTISKSTNSALGSMTILEPYGVTLIDSLVQAGLQLTPGSNYLMQPYMLQLDFKGYDNAGNPIPDSVTALYRKRFPIMITAIKVSITNRGAEYKIDFIPKGHHAIHGDEHSSTPKNLSVTVGNNSVTITGGTVKEFLDNFATVLNSFWQLEVSDGKRQYAESLGFDIDTAIASSTIIYPEQASVLKANPNSTTIQLNAGSFDIPAGTQIVTVIQKVLERSSYVQDQLGLNFQSLSQAKQQTTLTQILNVFKTTVQVRYAGADASGILTQAAFDNIRNTYPHQITYKIHQYPVYDANHPAAPLLTDSRPYVVKNYNYTYTGKNIDVLDLRLDFNTTAYTAVQAYTNQYASSQATQSIGIDTLLANGGTVLLSPQLLAASGVVSGFGSILNITPLRYKPIVNDQRDTIGFNNIDNPGTQTVSNMMRSLYSKPGGDMIQLKLKIVGDPTLIKQDDWLYVPSPTTSTIYNSWDSLNQNDFAGKYGHIRMDTGALIVSVTINTPLDIDTDWTNQGLAFPQPSTQSTSLFSGRYKINTIKNIFSGGVFEQELDLIKLVNDPLVSATAPATNGRDSSTTGSASQSQSQQNTLNNTAQPTGEAVLNSSGQVTSGYDATRYSI